jgi:Lon protease-like protein
MSSSIGSSDPKNLPQVIPIFPLAGVLLLPGGRLPLSIFEPRYLAMTVDALGGDRLIGMVQPKAPEQATRAGSVGDRDAVYDIGCAGRISEFQEAPDGRFLIALTGTRRFRIVAELPLEKGYRRVTPDWAAFADDGVATVLPSEVAEGLLGAYKAYASYKGFAFDSAVFRSMPADALVTSLAMLLPFQPSEKQALLEGRDAGERARLLTRLMAIAAHEQLGPAAPSVRH